MSLINSISECNVFFNLMYNLNFKIMKKILKGEQAKKICEEILDQFYVDETYHKHVGSRGYFKDLTASNNPKEVIVAFDNSTGDCWIEQFTSVNAALQWLG